MAVAQSEAMTAQTSFSSIQMRPEFQPMLQPVEMRMILLAGADVEAMEEASVRLFRAGHMPLMGAWFSDPLTSLAGLDRDGADSFHQIVNPLGERLLARCDAVLRLGGPSVAGDAMVAIARARGLRVFFSTSEALDG
jgi:hypothetical protein